MPPPEVGPQDFIKGMDRLAYKLYGGLARIFGSLAARNEETYWFGIVSSFGRGFVDLAATVGDNPTASIEVGQEADFVATRFLGVDVNPVTGIPIVGSWELTGIRDGGSDREILSTPIHRDDLMGNALRSVPFTKNRLFRRNSTITFSFKQIQTVATRAYVAVQGFKVYDEAALDLVRRR
jgi:hypothetical protein